LKVFVLYKGRSFIVDRPVLTSNKNPVRLLLPVVIGAGCMMAMLSAVGAIAEYAHPTPHLGDIVSFAAFRNEPAGEATRLMVHRENQFDCVLDLNILHQSGGSLVVESQVNEAAQSFRVHWAGERTTADGRNCGDKADLIIDVRDLDVLALSAGGYGLGRG
jgi:hypothetical protein